MEVDNKTLAVLLVIAIAVSTVGTIISLNRKGSSPTGFAVSNDTGTATVAVQTNTVLRFDINSIDFGSGYVNTTSGYNNCTLSINGSTTTITKTGCVGFNTTTAGGPFILQNAGTTYLNVTINASDNASTFIGGGSQSGISPLFQYAISNNQTGSCLSGLVPGTWTDVVKGTQVGICQNLSYVSTHDTLMMGILVSIPYDAASGSRTATFVAQGTG